MEPENKAAGLERKLRISKKARLGILALCAVLLLAAAAFSFLRGRTEKKVYLPEGLMESIEYYSLF